MTDPMPPPHPPTDYRKDRRRNDRHLAWAVVIFLVGVGGSLITLIYGGTAAIMGVTCLMAGAAIFGLIWLILTLMERWAGDD
jgi:fatty acid desaturase